MKLQCIAVFLLLGFSLRAQEMTLVDRLYLDPDISAGQAEVLQDFVQKEVGKRIFGETIATEDGAGNAHTLHILSKEYKDWPSGLSQIPPLANSPESYRILSSGGAVYVQGYDFRGLLFGLGHFLRKASYADKVFFPNIQVAVSPDKPIRGHQIGYRNTANAYDAWTADHYEQYIRDMIVFGANSLENIPFAEDSPIHFTLSNWKMNLAVSRLCDRYDMDYWVWTPIEFDLKDTVRRQDFLGKCARFFKEIKRLDHVFVPGGDPGANPPKLVLPMMEEIGKLLRKYHPNSKMWLSLQGFGLAQREVVYSFLQEKMPEGFGGLVGGPGSPPLSELRQNLPQAYALRDYPDITHTVRCQYPIWWWDPAFNFVLGREPIGPQPVRFQNIFLRTQPYTDGFITYSDGIHDDLNKMLWSQLGVDPGTDLREILVDYANYFLLSQKDETVADALFALEENWEGPIKINGGITATLHLWEALAAGQEASSNWRMKMYLVRACLDAFIRERFIFEEQLEWEANQVLTRANELGADKTMDRVRDIYSKSKRHFKNNRLRRRIFALSEELFETIGFQTSVPLYHAKNPERGAYLDFIDRPLNNQWWVESEFDRIKDYNEKQKIAHLQEIGNWENPGSGSFYDDVGNVYKSSHVIKLTEGESDPNSAISDYPGFDWWDEGYNRSRLSWMSSMGWPYAMRYDNLDPKARYKLVYTGVGKSRILADGVLLETSVNRTKTGEKVEVPVPVELTEDGNLELQWEKFDESHLNWRQHSRLNELWIIKQ